MPDVLLGFDFGTKRIGVALANRLLGTARPLAPIQNKHGQPDWPAIHALIKTWQPDALIVGVPLNMDGTEQPITQLAKQFMKHLSEKTQLPIIGMDERLTTVSAKQQLFEAGGYKALKSNSVDSMAATILLEDWMRQQHE